MDERIYISMSNGNRIVGYHSWPTTSSQQPDFVIGAPDLTTNTLLTNHIITNPQPAVSGKRLYVISDFDHTLSLWDPIPTETGTAPTWTRTLEPAPRDISIHGDVMVVAGQGSILIWNGLPGETDEPEKTITGELGGVALDSLISVSWDGTYFVLGVEEDENDALYLWEGLPSSDQKADTTLSVPDGATLSGINSNGRYLVAADYQNHRILVYDLTSAASGYQTISWEGSEASRFNLPEGALVTSDNRLFVADTVFSRVLMWKELGSAINGEAPDIVLGEENFEETTPEIGEAKVAWPAFLEFDGTCLWVGEYKFSNRLLRFCPGGL